MVDARPVPPEILTDLFSLQKHKSSLSISAGDDSVNVPTPASPDSSRPYVTLTFAQSLDGKIAGKDGLQLALSGKESLVMTHWMRTMHDAIMVGIGTALNDDPQLNTRHLPQLPAGSAYRYHLPRPVILDSSLRFSPSSKLLKNFKEDKGRRPWVVCSPPQDESDLVVWNERRQALESAGAKIVEVHGSQGHVSIPALLSSLRELGIRSLMVEGGARVIRSFLAEAQSSIGNDKSRSVDAVIVTTAPLFVGADGVGYESGLSSSEISKLQHFQTELFGRDVVMALKFTS